MSQFADEIAKEPQRKSAVVESVPTGLAPQCASSPWGGAPLTGREYVQMRESQFQRRRTLAADALKRSAGAGVSEASLGMPHAEQIQKSFGRHSIGDIKSAVGGKARTATEQMGAEAYATGNTIAFKQQPDLHTAAHEAAHVIQQRGGVQLKSGVGQQGDAYEQHADQVADLVVQGKSAEGLLDKHAGPATAQGVVVQRKQGPGNLVSTKPKVANCPTVKQSCPSVNPNVLLRLSRNLIVSLAKDLPAKISNMREKIEAVITNSGGLEGARKQSLNAMAQRKKAVVQSETTPTKPPFEIALDLLSSFTNAASAIHGLAKGVPALISALRSRDPKSVVESGKDAYGNAKTLLDNTKQLKTPSPTSTPNEVARKTGAVLEKHQQQIDALAKMFLEQFRLDIKGQLQEVDTILSRTYINADAVIQDLESLRKCPVEDNAGKAKIEAVLGQVSQWPQQAAAIQTSLVQLTNLFRGYLHGGTHMQKGTNARNVFEQLNKNPEVVKKATITRWEKTKVHLYPPRADTALMGSLPTGSGDFTSSASQLKQYQVLIDGKPCTETLGPEEIAIFTQGLKIGETKVKFAIVVQLHQKPPKGETSVHVSPGTHEFKDATKEQAEQWYRHPKVKELVAPFSKGLLTSTGKRIAL